MSDENKVWQPVQHCVPWFADDTDSPDSTPLITVKTVHGEMVLTTYPPQIFDYAKSQVICLPPGYALCRLVDAPPAYPEPDWSDAPDGAEWYAVDATGDSHWYTSEPYYLPRANYWRVLGGEQRFAGEVDLPLGCDWRLTLRRRPNTQQGA